MIANAVFCAAALCVVLTALQALTLRLHLRKPARAPRSLPPMSILKPLCGVDDGLEWNLRSFAELDYPRYEVLLGVRHTSDPAYALACRMVEAFPGRFRVIVQRGAPGLNPKVNQLITLEAAARHGIVVVSDSNIRVRPGYLRELASLFEDPRTGLVTNPVVGVGERSLGAALDNLQLSCGIAPGVTAAKRLAGQDIVVGKSMALRRRDLRALGGFARLKDVLAEDFMSGVLVREVLGKRVALAPTPVQNVTREQSVATCFRRYLRWSVMQRRAVGNGVYFAQALLHPMLFGVTAVALDPSLAPAALLLTAAKIAVDDWAARGLRTNGFRARALLSPAKDAIALAAWACGLFTDRICWRGNELRVLPGTVLEPVHPPEVEAHLAA